MLHSISNETHMILGVFGLTAPCIYLLEPPGTRTQPDAMHMNCYAIQEIEAVFGRRNIMDICQKPRKISIPHVPSHLLAAQEKFLLHYFQQNSYLRRIHKTNSTTSKANRTNKPSIKPGHDRILTMELADRLPGKILIHCY